MRRRDWKEANRIIAAWSPMFPKPPLPEFELSGMLYGGKYEWQGCRATTQFSEMCRGNPNGAEACFRHRPLNKLALKELYRRDEMPIDDYCKALGLGRYDHDKYREKVIEDWYKERLERE